jgi:hypothetical protein
MVNAALASRVTVGALAFCFLGWCAQRIFFSIRKPAGGIVSSMGVYFQSCERILANVEISQHAKLDMAGFALYLLAGFNLRCRMVEFRSKHLAGQPSAFSQERTFHRKGRPATPSSQNRASRGPRSRKGT